MDFLSHAELIWLALGLGFYIASFVNPNVLKWFVRDPKSALTKKSKWVRMKTRAFIVKVFRITFPAVLLLVVTVLSSSALTGMIWGIPGLYSLAGYFYARRLKKKYELWQQLGYDGPPELEEQAARLTTTHTHAQHAHD